MYRILPALTSEFVNPDMVPFVLPNVLLIAEECTKEEYMRLILPDLTPVFKQQEPIQVHAAYKNAHGVILFLRFPPFEPIDTLSQKTRLWTSRSRLRVQVKASYFSF